METNLNRYAPWMLSILRIVTALVYLAHGTQKLFHFPPMQRFGGGGAGGRGPAAAAQQADDAASSALSSAVDAVSSLASSIAPPTSAPGAPPDGMPPSMQTVFLIGGLIELIGGVALVLGLFTRPIAFIVAGECAVIFWWMHVGRSGNIFPISNGGESAVLFCFTFLYLVFAGPGAFAVDDLLKRGSAA